MNQKIIKKIFIDCALISIFIFQATPALALTYDELLAGTPPSQVVDNNIDNWALEGAPANSTTSSISMPTNVAVKRQIVIHAKSSYAAGYAHLQLKLGDQLMQEWNVSGTYQNYIHDTERDLTAANLKIYFTNDYYKTGVGDRNLYVDYITIDGVKYMSADTSVYVSGVWQSGAGCVSGYKKSIKLDCNGYFEYPSTQSIAAVLPTPTPALSFNPLPTPSPTPTLTFSPSPAPTTTPSPTVVPTPSPTSETIDTLSYFISKHPTQSLGGTHALSQTTTGQNIYYVKWAADSYEIYSYDSNYIYVKEDHSGSPVPGSYTYSDGRWLKRNMQVGEVIDASTNKIQAFSGTNCTSGGSTVFPYKVTLENHIANYDLGGTLGKQDVIVIRYDYQSTGGDYEKSYYSKDWGWVKWELYRGGQLIQASNFNTISDQPPTSPNLAVSCMNAAVTPAAPTAAVPTIPTTQSGLVSHLYSCVLKTNVPDSAGANYWLTSLQNKSLTIPQLYTYFYGYQAGVSNADFVTSMYNCILFRAPDQGGYDYWLGILNANQDTRANQVQYMLGSSGFTGDILPKLNALK